MKEDLYENGNHSCLWYQEIKGNLGYHHQRKIYMVDIYSEIATAGTSYEIYTDLNRFF